MDRQIVEVEKLQFNIAEQWVEISLPVKEGIEPLLPSFVPFVGKAPTGIDMMCSLQVVYENIDPDFSSIRLMDAIGVVGNRFRLLEMEKSYAVELQMVENGPWSRLVCNKYFTEGYAYVDINNQHLGEILSAFMMVMFAQSAILHKMILIHASVVVNDGIGYAFLGKSGTGKSTHSSLWLRYLESFELLNDDNPAIRIGEDGEVYVYGTPWSGKTPCYKNRKARLGGLVRLEQAPANSFYRESGVTAILALLPGCSSMRWNNKLYMSMVDILEIIVRKVPVGRLKCLPNKEAALLCYSELKRLN